jgi:hypothetical protein
MENCVDLSRPFLQDLDGLRRWQNDQLHATLVGLTPHCVHHGKPPIGSSANDQARASPGNVFFQRQWRVTEGIAELLGRFLLAFVNVTLVDNDIVLVGDAVDVEGSELEVDDPHRAPHLVQAPKEPHLPAYAGRDMTVELRLIDHLFRQRVVVSLGARQSVGLLRS